MRRSSSGVSPSTCSTSRMEREKPISDGHIPLWDNPREVQIAHQSWPQAYVRVTADPFMSDALYLTGSPALYGRRNILGPDRKIWLRCWRSCRRRCDRYGDRLLREPADVGIDGGNDHLFSFHYADRCHNRRYGELPLRHLHARQRAGGGAPPRRGTTRCWSRCTSQWFWMRRLRPRRRRSSTAASTSTSSKRAACSSKTPRMAGQTARTLSRHPPGCRRSGRDDQARELGEITISMLKGRRAGRSRSSTA